jgi:diguanylate cyclase (GGDEF)-like protein
MHNKLVLVVEDDAPIRMLLTELLQAGGLRVATLPDGERVLDFARESRPGAIVLDIGLPGKHGLAVLDELKEQPDLEAIPVLVCSAWCDAGLVNRAMASGAFDYVRKPFAGDEVVSRVKSAMSAAAPPRPDELTDEVRRLMREDRLTGLPNRLGLEERFEERLADAELTGDPLALVMVRVDGFEELARWGEPAANDLLVRMLAGELARRIRPGDAIGRFGEDSFLIVARRCDLGGAEKLADRMHDAAVTVHARAGWTVSVGFSATDVCEPDELLSSCDIALARAADAGGDRTQAGLPARRVGA